MRIIFYTGKGGVGKTSVAAATACRLAEQGKRVLVMSTDQAHSLGDAFGVRLAGEPMQILENLDALEIDVVSESEKAWGMLQDYLKELLLSHAQGGLEAEELLIFPGLEELFSLFKILDFYEGKRGSGQQASYDILIIDCAPTGETLSKLVKMASPVVERVAKIPMPGEDLFEELLRLVDKLERLQCMMRDRSAVSLRIVTTPEKIVMREAKHNFTCLHLYGYQVDAVIVNRIYPRIALEGYFQAWDLRQEESLRELRESFGEVPLFTLELQEKELQGTEALREAAKLLYGEKDPAQLFFSGPMMETEKRGSEILLRVYLPFAEKEEIEMETSGEELVITVRNEKRRFTLPDMLKGKEAAGARLQEGWLEVRFG